MKQEKVWIALMMLVINSSLVAQAIMGMSPSEFTPQKNITCAFVLSQSGEAGGEIAYSFAENLHAGIAASVRNDRTSLGMVLHGMVLRVSNEVDILFTMPVLYSWMSRETGGQNWWISLTPNISGNLMILPYFSICAGVNVVLAVFVTPYERKENIIVNDFFELDRNVRYQIPQYGYRVVPNIGSTVRLSSVVSFSINVWLNFWDRGNSILWTSDDSRVIAAVGVSYEL